MTKCAKEALKEAWKQEVGEETCAFKGASPVLLSNLLQEFIGRHAPGYETQVSDIVNRIVETSGRKTPFSIVMDSLYGSSSGGGSSSGNQQHEWAKPFNSPFQDPGGRITTYVVGKFDRCTQDFYNRLTYYAPFVPIVQSSGWGKSKIMKHMASEGIIVFYFCLLDNLSSGYPQADRDIADVFAAIKSEEDAYAIFYACLDWLRKQPKVPDLEQLFQQQQDMAWPDPLKKSIIGRKPCSKEKMQGAFRAVWKMLNNAGSLRAGVQILFVVDEARHLLQHQEARETPFSLFRRASSDFTWHLPTQSGALVVVIDTSSKVSNLAPRHGSDPSARVVIRDRLLFNPISSIPSFNVSMTPQDVSTLEEASSPLTLFSRGRPLWAAALLCVEQEEDLQKIEHLLDLAKAKLMGGKDARKFLADPKSGLVLLGRRISVEVCPQDSVAEELVTSHMLVCLYTSSSRKFMLTTILPEPVLAEAAAQLGEGRIAQQLQHLNSSMLKGLVSTSERGELVARFLLLNAMDELNKTDVKPQFLELFLQTLTRGKWKGFGRHAGHFKKAKVFFNAFYPFFGRNPTHATLQEFLRNAGALIGRQGQIAYDLYIPFVTPNQEGVYDFSDIQHLHCMAVQVKNRKDILNSKSILQEMSNHAFNLVLTSDAIAPSILLVLQLGESETAGCCLNIENVNQVSIALEGLNAIQYEVEWKASLVALLRERPDPKSVMQSEGAAQVDVEAVAGIKRQLYDPVLVGEPAVQPHLKGKQAAAGTSTQVAAGTSTRRGK